MTAPPANADTLLFFNDEEAKFVTAAIDRLIPGDDRWAGAKDAGVLYYIDRQLAGGYGAGARMYLKGPWSPDAPTQQSYQLRYSPAELYRIGIAESRKYVTGKHSGRELWDLGADDADAALKELESGTATLDSIPSPVFFETLLANTIEGYFADPIYGGNRDMVSWRMLGFPGAYAQYFELVDQYGYVYSRPPLGIASDSGETLHSMAE
jgi:gluconate 2-dehydrogenase gamma chain